MKILWTAVLCVTFSLTYSGPASHRFHDVQWPSRSPDLSPQDEDLASAINEGQLCLKDLDELKEYITKNITAALEELTKMAGMDKPNLGVMTQKIENLIEKYEVVVKPFTDKVDAILSLISSLKSQSYNELGNSVNKASDLYTRVADRLASLLRGTYYTDVKEAASARTALEDPGKEGQTPEYNIKDPVGELFDRSQRVLNYFKSSLENLKKLTSESKPDLEELISGMETYIEHFKKIVPPIIQKISEVRSRLNDLKTKSTRVLDAYKTKASTRITWILQERGLRS